MAEIEKRAIEAGLHDGVIAETREDECYSILSIIDTLEVKEVGVDFGDPKGDKSAICIVDTKKFEVKEVDLDFTKKVDMWIGDNEDSNGFFNVQELAKHFFELGLKAQEKDNE